MASSSSSATDARALLQRAFSILEREAPAHADMLGRALATLDVVVCVGREHIRPAARGGALVAEAGGAHAASVIVTTELATVVDLLDARRSLLEVVRAGALDLRGTTADLRLLAHAARVFLHGLVRSPTSPTLYPTLLRLRGTP